MTNSEPEPEASGIFFLSSHQGHMNVGMEHLWKHMAEPQNRMPYCRVCSKQIPLDTKFTVQSEQVVSVPGDGTTLIYSFELYFSCLEHTN